MKIFAISDLHLSGINPKPMDIFGDKWINHWNRIKEDWSRRVDRDDVVLIPGDISWALNLDDAMHDIMDISSMPGTKILTRGNHDYWWSSPSKMRRLLPGCTRIIQNDYIDIGDYLVSGTRGWMLPGDERFTGEDCKIFNRELIRLELSLSQASKGCEKPIIAMLHYPPFNEKRQPSEFINIMLKYNVKVCVYGHLHGESLKNITEGEIMGIRFFMVSCDYLGFRLKELDSV